MLSIYRDRLINISTRNRTLLLKKLYKKVAFDLKSLEKANGEKFCERLLKLLTERYDGKIKILSPPYDENISALYEDLKRLYKENNSIQREKGSHDLCIGYPFVEGKFKDGTLVKAPLLLFPVSLKIENDEVFLQNINDEYININKTFIMGFKKYNEIKLRDFELEFEELKDVDILNWIVEYLSENGIFIDKENDVSCIEEFKEINNSNTSTYELGELSLKNNIIIGQFPNSTSSIYDDYIELINRDSSNRLINNLIHNDTKGTEEKSFNRENKELKRIRVNQENNYFVTELDYSQEKAIIVSEKSEELVIYGPPGTGKSQVIVNLIVNNLAKGKKILMVSQKKAALDVVYNRLLKLGLDNRVANIESPNTDRQKIFNKINNILENQERYFRDKHNIQFHKTSQDIESELEKLEKLSDVLNKSTSFGLTLNQLYTKSTNKYKYYIETLSDNFHEFKDINSTELEEMLTNIDRLSKYIKYDSNNLVLKSRKNFGDLQEIEKDRIVNLVERIKRYADEYNGEKLKDSSIVYTESLIVDKQIDTSYFLKRLSENLDLINNSSNLLDDKHTKNLNKLLQLSKVVKKKRIWTLRYWKSRGELKQRIKGYSIKNIIECIDETVRVNSEILKVKSEFGINDIHYTSNKKEIISKVENYIKSIETIDILTKEVYILEKYFNEDFLELLISNILKNKKWKELLEDIQSIISTDFEQIKILDYLKNKLSDKEKLLMKFCIEGYEWKNKEDIEFSKAIRNTIYLKHIEYIELENKEVLNSIDSPDDIKIKIENLLESKRKLVPEVIVDKLSNDIEDGTNYSDIKYEVDKKRNKMSLRKFVHSFQNSGLLKLLPCWLVTPEVVSSVLPLKEGIFDIVIFDEASQMFIENSIPSIYRAKSVVIAGDDKQLQPNDLYQVKVDNEEYIEEDEKYISKISTEVKSLLELAKYKYESVTLNYHYRSMYEELINFSNYAFYNGKIEVVPNINKSQCSPPIERIKIDGKWIDRKNIKEAEEVVQLIKKILLDRENNETIGIITFNSSQQECIEEMLDREVLRDIEFGTVYRKELERKEGNEYKGIFIKNIENVQGDERDIIIFSIGYAPNEEGRIVRNFGSLTMKSGENRLNVAISRARKKIYVITSIEPEELGYVDNLSRGAILLKKYLQYVRAVSNDNKEEARDILYSLDTIEKTNKDIIHFDSPFEEEVYEALVNIGLKVQTQVGTSSYRIDMAIYDEDRSEYILGIECDGATYHSSKSARERDMYRQRFLESRGWTIHRIWSRDWWKNKQGEVEKIKMKLESLKN